jgi:trans-aconitate methyltransferase
MEPIETGKAYDTITERWSKDRFNMNNGIDQHKRAISFVENRGLALDLGCGCTGRFIELLLTEGFQPEGLDVSTKKIEISRSRFPNLVFYNEDICQWAPTKKYDFITAWDSVWHVPLENQAALMVKIANSLNAGGVLIFSFGGVNEPGEHTDDTMGPMMYYSSLGTNGFMEIFIKNRCAIKHLEFDQYPELHAFLIVQKLA